MPDLILKRHTSYLPGAQAQGVTILYRSLEDAARMFWFSFTVKQWNEMTAEDWFNFGSGVTASGLSLEAQSESKESAQLSISR